MFGKSIRLFNILGFEIKIDLSWFFIVVLVVWSLGKSYFPATLPGLESRDYLVMAVIGAFGLFFSIIFHELHHSIVARHYGIPIRGITLFIFGGVAEMESEPPDWKSELYMAIAGPISSLYLGGIFFAAAPWLPGDIYREVFRYLGTINIILAVFNMIPAFPLDGGRVFRAILWNMKGNLKWATGVAARSGNMFGTIFMIMAAFQLFGGMIVGAVWWFLIGLFLKNASNMSVQQQILKETFMGEPVIRFMTPDPVTVSPGITVREFVDNYVFKSHHKLYPVVQNGLLLGCVLVKDIKNLPSDDWNRIYLADILEKTGQANTISPATDSMEALGFMNSSGRSRLMIAENGILAGILTLKDILELLTLKIDLDEKSSM